MPALKKFHVLKQEDLDRLLAWLDPDRERAGLEYENIRWRLVTILAARECPTPEELADETIDRVARRVADIQETYVGEKILYFLGVANNVHHEYLKRPRMPEPTPSGTGVPPVGLRSEDFEGKEETHFCLDQCLHQLPPDTRHLIQNYYAEDKQAKIDLRKKLAKELSISINTLRLRALRTREKLQACIEKCLDS